MGVAPSEAGGEKSKESSYTQVLALFFLLPLLTSSYLLSQPLSPSFAGGSSDIALWGLGTSLFLHSNSMLRIGPWKFSIPSF